MDNPLLKKPLAPEHIKPRLLGHWGTTPGLNLIYAHCNRVIRERDLDMIYIIGPGHGGPAIASNAWLEGSYSDAYPTVRRDAKGLHRLFRQFSFPGGIPSHVAPELPGSIHEGGELGYSLAHAFGAAFDNPELVVTCVVGDGEAETGALATSWQSTRFLDAARDGAVLPILHLNGYKIANPTVLSRIGDDALEKMLEGCGWKPYLVEGDDPELGAPGDGRHPRHGARRDPRPSRLRPAPSDPATRSPGDPEMLWPMIVLKTPEGLDRPGEGRRRARGGHVARPPGAARLGARQPRAPGDARGLAAQLPSRGAVRRRRHGRCSCCRTWAPKGERRMGANPHANGGRLTVDLDLPDFRDFGVEVPQPGGSVAEATRVLGGFMAEVMRRNMQNFRLFGPDETASNRLSAVFEVTSKTWNAGTLPTDEHLAPDGRVMEVLSEHLCQGWLEGYLLTGRHGLFSCYEAFIHIIDSMFNQHAKWLKTTQRIEWRASIPSLNYLLTSHVWRQDHNGFSHQDPGFIDHVVNKKAEVIRVYLPPDGNCLLSVADHCLRSRDYVNVVVAGKQAQPNWLTDRGGGGALCARHRRLGLGEQRRGRARRRARAVPATCRRWRRWPRPTCCASTCPTSRCGWSTSSTS